MSANNGVYILQTKDGFRVTHAQAIDNIHYNADKSGFNLMRLYQYFHDADFFLFKEDALKFACNMYKSIINDPYCPICEYGICPIDASHINFPKKEPLCCKNPAHHLIAGQLRCYNCKQYID